MLNKRGDPIKRVGWEDFFNLLLKNSGGGGGGNFVYYMKNKGRVSKYQKLNKRVYPFINRA